MSIKHAIWLILAMVLAALTVALALTGEGLAAAGCALSLFAVALGAPDD